MSEATTTEKRVFWRGTGRRKTAVARVRVYEGTGGIEVNGRPLEEFFTEEKDRGFVLGPMLVTGLRNRLDVKVNVKGGGFTGQAGAVSQGLARAIKEMFMPTKGGPKPSFKAVLPESAKPAAPPEGEEAAEGEGAEGEAAVVEAPVAPPEPEDAAVGLVRLLRESGYLTRDSRMKERKKYGRKGARKSFQFSKR